MKSLVESISESLNITEAKKISEKQFWKFIKDLGEEKAINLIVNSQPEYDAFYQKIYDLGIKTVEDYEPYYEWFINFAVKCESDPEYSFGSDDSYNDAKFTAPFYGEQVYKKHEKQGTLIDLCDQYDGEHCGYAVPDYAYGDWLKANKK